MMAKGAAIQMEIGQKVPDFTLPATTGQNLTLSAACAAGKGVVLTTFPLAFTGL
jgi:peroxiredoxin